MIELIHPEMSSVSKKDIKAKLSQTMKTKDENISIFGLKTKFGGGRSTGFALIYDTLDARKKYDTKKMLRRVSNATLSDQDHFSGWLDHKSFCQLESLIAPLLYRTAIS